LVFKRWLRDPQVGRLLRQGLAYQRAGRRGAAAACYRSTLRAAPHCAPALHLLGLLAEQVGQHDRSIQWMRASLAVAPERDDAATLNSLARAYWRQGHFDPARRCYQRLAELLPRSAPMQHRLGTTLEWLGDWDAAADAYRRALALQPASADIHGSLARLACRQGAWDDAVECCRRSLALAPGRHELHNLLGYALVNAGDLGAAVEVYRRALELEPNSPYAVYGLGYLFERRGELASAAESYRLAIHLAPRLIEAHLHLGITHYLRGEWEQAAGCFERAQALDPDNAEVQTFFGHLHLLAGDFSRGWKEYEQRWRTPHFWRGRRELPQPQWHGEPLAGARILLHAEQGLGDTLQFVRYVPLVAARGGQVTLEVQPPLHRLLASADGARAVLRRGDDLPEVDWQCPLLSLPLAFATDLASIPAPIPYVRPDPALVAAWRERLAGNALRVGLVWGGNPNFPHERWRSIPLELLAPLTQVAGTAFYSLQVGPASIQVAAGRNHVRMVDLREQLRDFADTAAVIANLDLVISVDTSVAHLAGAMGKPVWLLLHKSADWRWLLGREDSPWYPTARLFRQSTLGNWHEVVARVDRELRELVARTATGDQVRPP
jgi:tetratricopeptide (TPR) repeat protein